MGIEIAAAAQRIRNAIVERAPHLRAARDAVTAAVRENRDQVRHIAATVKDVAVTRA